MRLFKKSIAGLICLTMLCGICLFSGGAVSAATLTLADDFNACELTDAYFSISEQATLSQYFTTFQLHSSINAGERFKVVSAEGADGAVSNTMEVISTSSSAYYLDLKYTNLTENEIGRLYYDICFTSWEEVSDALMQLTYSRDCGISVGADTNGVYFYEGAGNYLNKANNYPITLGKWYTVAAEISYGGATSWRMTSRILDASTGVELFSCDGTDYERKFHLIVPTTAETGAINFQMDNISFYVGTETDSPVLRKATLTDGKTNVPRNQTLVFDFYLPFSGCASLLKDGVPVEGATADTRGYNRLAISYEGLLEKNSTYTVSLADLGLADISFTTENLHLWNDVIIENVAQNGDNTDITFKLSDDFGYSTFSGYILAAWYSGGAMQGFDLIERTAIAAGETVTEGFSLGGTPQTGDAIELLQMDKDYGLTALARAEFIIQ